MCLKHGVLVVNCLPKFSGKSSWKVIVTIFLPVLCKISGSNETSEKVVMFFRDRMFQVQIHVPLVKNHI